jgi:probable RNA-binding protein EIF1AD
MKAGRKNLKREALEHKGVEEPQEGHVLMRVVGLRGGNIVEAENAAGETTLCLLPAKFQKTIWIKTGTVVVVDEADREKALEAGSKVTGTISRVLLEDQVRALRKSAAWWPESFKDERLVYKDERVLSSKTEEMGGDEEGSESDDDDDGLPPLEANSNRQHAMSTYEHVDSDDSSDDEDLEVDKSKHALP